MVGLIDIGPLTEKATVNGKELELRGVPVKVVFRLFAGFKELRAFIAGVATDQSKLLELGGEGIGAIIAAGLGKHDDAEAIAWAAALPAMIQIDLVLAILKVTMPGGVGPLAEKIAALTGALGVSAGSASGDPSTTAPDTSSPAE